MAPSLVKHIFGFKSVYKADIFWIYWICNQSHIIKDTGFTTEIGKKSYTARNKTLNFRGFFLLENRRRYNYLQNCLSLCQPPRDFISRVLPFFLQISFCTAALPPWTSWSLLQRHWSHLPPQICWKHPTYSSFWI